MKFLDSIAWELSKNDHKIMYQPVEEYLEDAGVWDEIPEKVQKEIVESDTLYELRWYPDTPVGFHTVYASTIEGIESQLGMEEFS